MYDSLNISFAFRYQDYISNRFGNNATSEEFQTLLWFNNTLQVTPLQVGIPLEQLVVASITEATELFMAIMNIQVMVIIVWFVTLVFIETFRRSSGTLQSKKLFYFTKLVTIFTVINSIGLVVITIFANIVTILNRLAYVINDLVIYAYILCLTIFVFEVIIQITMLVIAAFAVMKTISKIAEDQKKKRNAIVKVLVLQSGLFGCFLFEALAAASGVAQENPSLTHLTIAYCVFNTLGILVFAFTTLALYTPIHLLKENQTSLPKNGSTHSPNIRRKSSKHHGQYNGNGGSESSPQTFRASSGGGGTFGLNLDLEGTESDQNGTPQSTPQLTVSTKY